MNMNDEPKDDFPAIHGLKNQACRSESAAGPRNLVHRREAG